MEAESMTSNHTNIEAVCPETLATPAGSRARQRDQNHGQGHHVHYRSGAARELERREKRSALRQLKGTVRFALDLEKTRRWVG